MSDTGILAQVAVVVLVLGTVVCVALLTWDAWRSEKSEEVERVVERLRKESDPDE
jgi:uncharacterized membrane protein